MANYEKVLLALDLSEESEQLRDKAALIAKQNNASLYLIHVVEPLSFAYGGDVPVDIAAINEQLNQHAQERLERFAEKLDYPVERLIIVTGQTESEVHRCADDLGIDLVLVGSHGRHGLALLLGSTANGILHGANCDVLAIRIKEQS